MDPNARYYGAAASYNKPAAPLANPRIFVLIGIILVVLILVFVAFGLFSSFSNAPRDRLAALIAHEQALQTFVTTNQSKVTDRELSKVSSETDLLLTSDTVSLLQQLDLRYGMSAVPKEIAALEADTTSAATLTQATQSGKFNETYKDLLTQKLATALSRAEAVQPGTSGQLNAALEKNIQNIKTLQAELASD